MTKDTQQDRNARWRAGRNSIQRLSCEHTAVRAKMEKDTASWLRHYLPEAYPLPFGMVHHQMIDGAEETLTGGGKEVVVAPRGSAKSTVFWGVCLKWVLAGETPFPAYLPWKAKELRKALRFWRTALCFNPELLADYPEFCQPFAVARGSSQRCKTLTWEDSGEPTGAELLVSEGMIVMPDSLGVIGSSTINGNPRGMNHTAENGKVWRPSAALIDDAQSKEAAKSPPQVESIIDIIETDIAGMAGPTARMPMFLLGTISRVDDVVSHFTQQKDWKCVKVAQIVTWPDDMELWDRFGEMIHERKETDARRLYKANKKAMTKGLTVSWDHRYDRKRKEPDALYSAMRDFYFLGKEAFMAERQGEPIDEVAASVPYTLTSDYVSAHVSARSPYERPDWVTHVVASTDVNPSYALSTVLIGFGQDQTACILWYGLRKIAIPGNVPAQELARRLFAELYEHGKELAAAPIRPDVWSVDAGGANFDAVIRWAGESTRLCGIPCMGFTGRGAKNYKPYGKTMVPGQKREQCHGCLDRKDGRLIRWIAWHADYWREVSQRAWLGAVDSPGSISLPIGQHREFSAQVCGEKLLGKGEIGGMMLWNWATVPGRHDFGDAVSQGFATAAFGGIGTGGSQPIRKYVETRKCKVIREA